MNGVYYLLGACALARTIVSAKETVLKWVHDNNRLGAAVVFHRPNVRRRPFFGPEQVKQFVPIPTWS